MESENLNESLEALKGLGAAYLPVVAYLGAAVAIVAAAGELEPVRRTPGAMAIQAKLLHQAEKAILAACGEIDRVQDQDGLVQPIAVRAAEAVQDLVDSFLRSMLKPEELAVLRRLVGVKS